MAQSALRKWAKDFQAAAKADNYEILHEHLRILDLPDSPELLLDGTTQVLAACSAYYTIDSHADRFAAFLKMQRYDPTLAVGAKYVFTFDLFGKGYARILSGPTMREIDLADLYGHPWNAYERVGYHQLYISRIDWKPLTENQLRKLEKEVTDDLRFDFSDDELDFWFAESPDRRYLLLSLQDADRSAG